MAYIFLDESGDLGFNFDNKGTTKNFVITCLFVKDKKRIEKIIKRTHSELKKKTKRRIGMLHCYREKPATRKRLLKRVSKENCKIMIIRLNKKKVFTKIKKEKPVLYNNVTNTLLSKIYFKRLLNKGEKLYFIASKRETSKFLNQNFKKYITDNIKKSHGIDIEVLIKTPSEEKSLQAVDFVSWSVFRKYEHSDSSYYEIIKNKINLETTLFD